tara:strand:- start:236 stop:3043 length:2808 start_codon:yes stop_codon:yes gene_type:complete
MRNTRKGKMLTTTLPINTLSGGVGRQAPPKRLPKEAETLENVLCTIERSIEKRPGADLVPFRGAPNDSDYTGYNLPLIDGENYEYFWHQLSSEVRFLFAIDRSATDVNDILYHVFYYNPATDSFEDHTPDNQDQIPAEVRAYLTHEASSKLTFVAQAQNLLFMSPDVYAGYTSKPRTFTSGDKLDGALKETGEAWCKIGLDGKFVGLSSNEYIEDVVGGAVEYLTATKVDPNGLGVYWNEYSRYISGSIVLYLGGSQTSGPSDTRLLSAAQTLPPNANVGSSSNWTTISDRDAQRIAVKDWKYPDPLTPYYGQSVATFQDLRFPPPLADVESGNNNAEAMLAALYDLDNPAVVDGTTCTNSAEGKVYYVQGGYQGQAPGYYLMSSTEAPHSQKVRTPDGYSVIDQNRMPMELEFLGFDVSNGKTNWSWSTIDWSQRTSGDLENNPGPSPFKDGKQSQLASIAFFRNRLFLSAGDVIFCSRDGDFTDLWIEDPGIIVDSDPIDVAASSNKYTPITSMVPFSDYLFVNTSADTQYELTGSENQITPFTAELQPMTFYSTAPLTSPLTLGNNIFFYDKERLYMYLGRGGTLSTAQELSTHCPKYLPENYGPTVIAAAQDSILAVDADDPEAIYLYSTRYQGNQIAQNAFYNFRFKGASVESMAMWENQLYMVNKRGAEFFVERVSLRYEEPDKCRLDRRVSVPVAPGEAQGDALNQSDPKFNASGVNAMYNADENTTTLRVPYADAEITTIVLESGFDQGNGTSIVPQSVDASSGIYTDIVLNGDYTAGQNARICVGRNYTMIVELSPQFLRDPNNNNPREGVLNLASMTTRHYQTGNYDVVIQRRERPSVDVVSSYNNRATDQSIDPYLTNFSAKRVDLVDSTLALSNVEYQGEMVSRIMGFADRTSIYLMSDYWTPVNITNIELKGKFKETYSSLI